jgi:hypothetical protein
MISVIQDDFDKNPHFGEGFLRLGLSLAGFFLVL